MNLVELKSVTISEVDLLVSIGRQIYKVYYADPWSATGLELFLQNRFRRDKITADLKNDTGVE